VKKLFIPLLVALLVTVFPSPIKVSADHGAGSLCTDGTIILDDNTTCSDQGKTATSAAVQAACHDAGSSTADAGERAGARFACIQNQTTDADQPENPVVPGSSSGNACTLGQNNFFGVPPWHRYLDGQLDADGSCSVKINQLTDIWKIVLAVLQILLRVAAYVATGFMIYAGFRYMTSNGNPEKTKQALGSIRLAAIGLIITIASSLIVSFIAGRF